MWRGGHVRCPRGTVRRARVLGGKFLQGEGELRWLSEGSEPGTDPWTESRRSGTPNSPSSGLLVLKKAKPVLGSRLKLHFQVWLMGWEEPEPGLRSSSSPSTCATCGQLPSLSGPPRLPPVKRADECLPHLCPLFKQNKTKLASGLAMAVPKQQILSLPCWFPPFLDGRETTQPSSSEITLTSNTLSARPHKLSKGPREF